MSAAPDPSQSMIWATRGRSWGFRFLLNGGLADPLGEYERAFAESGDRREAWRAINGRVALRFPDPLNRRDSAGRVIPHEFVLYLELAELADSVEKGRQHVWPLVAAVYARVWDGAEPPLTMSSLDQ